MEFNSSELERMVWRVADSLRGTMPLHDVLTLTLGLIFLRYADHQFDLATAQLDSDGVAKDIDEEACKAQGYLYVPPQARFARLLEYQHPHQLSEGLNRALKTVAAENDFFFNPLPYVQDRVDRYALFDLLRAIADLSVDDDGKALTETFESILQNYVRSSSHNGSEFFTPYELATLMAQIVMPDVGMTVYDPCVGIGGTLLAAAPYVSSSHQARMQPLLYGQERNDEVLLICTMRLLVNGVNAAGLRLGDTLTQPLHLTGDRLTTFDRIVTNPPFSVSRWHHGGAANDAYNRFQYGVPPNSSADFAFIQHMLVSASPNGMVATIVPHGVLFRGGQEGRIRQGIAECDLIEAVIGLPPGLFFGTDISSAILVFNKAKAPARKGKILFIDASRDFTKQNRRNSLREDDVARIVSTFEAFSDVERYARVVDLSEIQQNAFNLNIPRYADSSQMAGLVTQYSQYEKCTLKDLTIEINSVSGNGAFEEKSNSVYIPAAGSKRTVENLGQLEGKHNSYFQVVLCEKAINGYVAQFLRSSVGQHAASVLAQGSVVKRINKSDLGECMIAVPDLDTQREIVSTHQQLSALKDAIGTLDQELSLNPTGNAELKRQVESLLAVIGRLSDADEVRGLIRQGESKTLEFKEVFSIEVKEKRKEQYMQTATFKTIVAFLNSEGGRLLVGVNDEQKIVGINDEIKNFHKDNLDDFFKTFKNLLRTRIGEEFYPFIDYRIQEVDGCKVFVVICFPSESPCFLDKKEFYVRTNPASDKLEGPKLVQYLNHRFKSQTSPSGM